MANRRPNFTLSAGDSGMVTLAETVGKPVRGASLQAQGRLSFTDADLNDRHCVSVTPLRSATGLKPLGSIRLVLAQDSNGGATGRLVWTYDVPARRVEFLAAGQTLTETFRIEVSDGRGGVAFQNVTVTITGSNDAPRIIETCQSSVSARLVEVAGTPSAGTRLSASGQIFYRDPDRTDQPTIGASFKPAAGQGMALGALVVTQRTIGSQRNEREVTWSYAVDAGKVEFLAKGQVYVETFTLRIDDHNGGVTTRDITITLVGTNDAPVISLQSGDSITGTLAAAIGSATSYSRVGRVSFRDVDLTDAHAVTVAFKSSTLANRSQIGTLSAVVLVDSTSGVTGQVGWTFAVSDAAARGLSGLVTEVFTLTVSDGQGGVTKQDVTLTLNFSSGNAPPVITVTNPAAVSEASTAASVSVNIAAQVAIADPDAADVRTPYAGGLAFQSATGPAPAGATLSSLFTLNTATGTISYDRAAFQYLAGGQSVTASFGFNSSSGPDTQAKTITVTINGVDDPQPSLFSFRLAGTDATTPGGTSTSASAVTFIGTGRPGDLVELFGAGPSPIATTRIDLNGAFQFSNVALTAGTNSFGARASNNTGPVQTFAQSVTLVAPSNTDNIATVWNRIALQSIAASAVMPEFASRALAIESIAIFNVISAINGTRGYLFNATAPAGASPGAAVAQAAHDALVNLFPSQKAALDALLATSLAAIPDGADKVTGVAFGASVAARVIALRANDGWNTEITDIGGNSVGQWRPTGPSFAPGADPQWANLTPFSLQSDDQFVPTAPPALTSQAYTDAYNEVKSLGAGDSAIRTADQTAIARFWAAGVGSYTPIGMWNDIANNLTTSKGLSLSQTAQMLVELNLAGGDAAIAAWNAKYGYDVWRPVTAIQNGEADGNTATFGTADWQPYLPTPAFPSYVSGHSTFSAAAATILDNVFGSATAFSATSLTLGGATRNYTSFDQAAAEAGQSRIYGGIHFQFDNQAGLQLGSQIGNWVLGQFNGAADTVAPTVSLHPALPRTTAGNLVLSGDATDNLTGVSNVYYSLDGGPLQSASFSVDGRFTASLTAALATASEGAHTVTVSARDAAGNVSTNTIYSFGLARTAPVLTLDASSVQANGTLSAGSRLSGSVTLPVGDSLVALSYRFDGGPLTPMAFDVQDGEIRFSSALDMARLAPGARTLTLTATDAAGATSTRSLSLTLPSLPLTVTDINPREMSMDVGVTFRPRVTFSRAVDISTLTTSSFYATDTTGAVLGAKVVPLADGTGAWLLFDAALPGASTITLHLDGNLIRTTDGVKLDGAGTGVAGSTLSDSFSTVSTKAIAGTSITGVVLDPGKDLQPFTRDDVRPGPNGYNDYANNTYLNPLAGVKVYILGRESEAVFTDASGRFTLTSVPVGDVKVAVDGRTATNAPAGQFFPEMVMDTLVRPGVVNTLMGGMGSLASQFAHAADPAVYLPRVPTDSMTALNTSAATVISATTAGGSMLTGDQLSRLTLTVQPGSLLDANGNPVANPTVGIAPVPASLVMDMLPEGILQHSFDITIQAPNGAVFTQPATLTAPNVLGLAPGTKTYVLSFDHTTGRLVIDGTATVSADGLTITTDPGSGITSPGWHGFAPLGSDGDFDPYGPCPPVRKTPSDRPGLGDYADATTNLVGFASTVDGIADKAGLTALPGGTARNAIGVGADLRTIWKTATELSKADGEQASDGNGAVDTSYRLIMGFKLLGDVAKLAIDTTATIVGSNPLTKNTPLAKVTGTAQLAITGAETVGTWTSGGSIFQPGIDLATKLQDSETELFSRPDANWKPPVNPELPAAISAFNAIRLQATQRDALRSPLLDILVGNLEQTKSLVDGWDTTKPNGGKSLTQFRAEASGIISSLDAATAAADALANLGSALADAVAVLRAIEKMAEAYARDTGMPIMQPSLDDLLKNLEGTTTSETITLPPPGTETWEPAETFYAAIKNVFDDSVQRLPFNSVGGLSVFLAPNTLYKLTVYDPATKDAAEVLFTSAGAGQRTAIPTPLMAQDDSPVQSNGLTPIANYVFGFGPDPSTIIGPIPDVPRSSLVPGMTDAQAISAGAITNPGLVNTTGPVAAVDLRGEARAVTLATFGTNAATVLAYVATGSYGLAIVNVTNRTAPVVLGQVQLTTAANPAVSIAVDPLLRYAAVATGSAVIVVDVSDPLAPRQVYVKPLAASDVQVRDGVFYAASNGQLGAYDLSTGEQLATAPLSQQAVNGLVINGNQLYVSDAAGVIRIFDISGDALRALGSISLPAGSGGLSVADGVLYVGGGSSVLAGGYATVDVSDPGNPVLISNGFSGIGAGATIVAGGEFGLNGSGRGVFVQRTVALVNGVAGGINAVDVLDVRNPLNTTNVINRFTLPAGDANAPGGVALANGAAFVAAGAAGLQVISYANADRGGVAPSISLSSLSADEDPATAGLQITEGRRTTFGVTVSDDVEVARVDLLVNGRLVQSAVTYPFDLSTFLPTIAQNGGSGTVTIQARATDTGGTSTLSAPLTVTLTASTVPFGITGLTPNPGQQIEQTRRQLNISFSAPVDPATVSSQSFRLTGPDGAAVDPSRIQVVQNGRVVRLTYDSLAAPGNYALSVDAATVRSLAGQVLGSAPIVSGFNVVPFDVFWTGGANGRWNDDLNWSTGADPTSGQSALVRTVNGGEIVYATPFVSGGPGATDLQSLAVTGTGVLRVKTSTVTGPFGGFPTQDLITRRLSNDATIIVDRTLTANGDIINTGLITTTSTSLNDQGRLVIKGDGLYAGTPLAGRVNLSGGGTIRLGGTVSPTQNPNFAINQISGSNDDNDYNTPNGFFSYFGNSQLVNKDNLITGQGTIGYGLDFLQDTDGKVIAQNGETLKIKPVGFALAGGLGSASSFLIPRYFTNLGLLEATSGGTLALTTGFGDPRELGVGTGVTSGGAGNNFGGQIVADGGTVLISGHMVGGTLSALNGGEIHGGGRNPEPFSYQGPTRLGHMTIDMRQAGQFVMKGSFVLDGGGAAQSFNTNVPVTLLGDMPVGDRVNLGVAGLVQDYGRFGQFGADASNIAVRVLGKTVLDGGGGNGVTGIFEVANIGTGTPSIIAPFKDDSSSPTSARFYAPANTLSLQYGMSFRGQNAVLGYDQGYTDQNTGDVIPAPKWSVAVDQTSVLEGWGNQFGPLTLLNLDLHNQGRVQTNNGGSLIIRDSVVTSEGGYLGTNDNSGSVLTFDNSSIISPTVFVTDLIEAGFLGTLSFKGTNSIQDTPLRVNDQGTLELQAGADLTYTSAITFGFPNVFNQSGGTIRLNAGSKLTVDANVDNSGKIVVNGGELTFDSSLEGQGEIDLNGQAKVSIAGSSSQTVQMTGADNLLLLNNALGFQGQVLDFGIGDTLDLADVDFNGITSIGSGGDLLQIVSNGIEFNLTVSPGSDPGSYQISDNGTGGTQVRWQ